MGGFFSKPSKPAPLPPPPPPPPIPDVTPETEDFARKQARRRSGFRKTIITGALEPAKKGKTILG